MARSDSGDSVVDRVARILQAFTPEEPALAVSEVAVLAGLPLSTASRLVEQLVGHGLLMRGADGRIRIGVRMWELASRASPTLGLRESVMPFLEDVHAVTGHHAQLGVLNGHEVLFLERLSAPDAVISMTRIAGRLPLHASSAGLVLLAHAQRDLQEAVLRSPLRAFTSRTVTDSRQLRLLLARIRQQGYVLCPGYIHADAAGLAVPLRDHEERVVAALSVVVPDDGHALEQLAVLRAAARGVHRSLSGPGSSTH